MGNGYCPGTVPRRPFLSFSPGSSEMSFQHYKALSSLWPTPLIFSTLRNFLHILQPATWFVRWLTKTERSHIWDRGHSAEITYPCGCKLGVVFYFTDLFCTATFNLMSPTWQKEYVVSETFTSIS